MSNYTKQDILDLIMEEDVEFIRLQFTDMYGNLKNVAITASQIEKALNNKFIFDGSSVEGYVQIEEADLYLHPDLDTFVIFPWRPQQGKVARMICDVYRPNGMPYEGDPRYILKQAIKEAESLGYTFHVGPECEFFLFHTNDDALPTTNTHEKAGYFDCGPLDLGENTRRDMVLTLEEMGFEVESSHHEGAPAQHEIDFKYDDALTTADNIMTFKLVVKTIAKRHGLYATFMPKPKSGVNGSGMHINMSLSKNGVNIFSDESDKNGLSKEGYYFMGGIMEHIKGMTAITNPLVNSYKRLVPGYEAPVHIGWSVMNRTPLLRIPTERGESTRVELRSPDPSANPYLALAVCLRSGLEGIKNKVEPPKSMEASDSVWMKEEEIGKDIETLPCTLLEAIRELKKDELVKDTLGEYMAERYVAMKNQEWNQYRSQVTEWEIEQYLSRY